MHLLKRDRLWKHSSLKHGGNQPRLDYIRFDKADYALCGDNSHWFVSTLALPGPHEAKAAMDAAGGLCRGICERILCARDISIANMLNIQKNLVVKNRKLKSYGTWYIVVALLFVISQIIGALAVLITDRITETTLLSYAGRVLFLVVFDWAVFRRAYVVAAFVLNIRKVTTARSSMNRHRSASMLERESLDEYEERMTQPSTIYMPRLMFRLKLFVASSLIGFLVAVSAGSILMYRSVSSHQNSAVYSRTYQDDRKDFNLYVDFGVFLVLLLMTSNLLFSRVDIDWKAFGCGVFFVTDKGTEMKTGGDRSSVLWSKESKDIGTAIDDASDVFEVLEDFASG
eukprot:jgi/Bigna1/130239/aug1.10_g4947